MKDLVKFILFLLYATFIFFLPNNNIILFVFFANITILILAKVNFLDTVRSLIKFLPFILLTAIINCILGYWIDAIWIAIKLLLVCHITFIYSRTTTVVRNR